MLPTLTFAVQPMSIATIATSIVMVSAVRRQIITMATTIMGTRAILAIAAINLT